MRIALAVDGNYVSQHFGHCEGFELVDIQDNEVKNRVFVPNPGHRPGFLPKFLSEKGVNAIIAGGMGETAQALFNENGIDVLVGISGSIEDVIKEYIDGKLVSSNEVCERHEHHGECGH
ncbi:dinitrogenase iron-molybdenum cofactor [Caloranaerobacter azorensis H53214]|uniref:Dinitrogenase iron-molybdenum cofactor n=1 Tax=Caloranaerobacter azorensis H53214 TaxID=1156417 RepID=A0A096CV79_9FIRM|nr:NifB/NifX family molybdenum-iron cluster-binding protein [Caloranaerobacter azorensis]KGG80449.1 dinitrogenase iron-molybdenum cofactor [Caloranaerobacter azorensis H53214]